MDSRITNAAVKKPSVVRVKPIPRKNQPPAPILHRANSPIHVPLLRTYPAQHALVRRPQTSKHRANQPERAVHQEELRRRVRGLLQQAADLRTHGANSRSAPQSSHYVEDVDEVDGSPLAGLLSILLGQSHTDKNVRRPIQRILTEIDNVLREDVEHQLMIAQERSDRQLEGLTLRLEQTLRQRETSHLREIIELHGRVDYLQDQLKESREMNENLERQLENANLELLERSHGMGSTIAEVEDLREEVKELRLFKAKYRQGMESIDQLREELEKQKLVAKTTYEEFAKVEKERDELRLEFDKNLQKLRKLNQRRHHAIMAEIDEAEDEILP
ncbi:hypothetical protein V3C99_014331 [Haemonchus contortus]